MQTKPTVQQHDGTPLTTPQHVDLKKQLQERNAQISALRAELRRRDEEHLRKSLDRDFERADHRMKN